MNSARLQDIYQDIGIADKGDIDSIRQLTIDYPFYWMPYVILAKYYFDTGHYKFEEMLKQAAMRVHDRRELYNYIHGRNVTREAPQIVQAPIEAEVTTEFVESGIGEIGRLIEAEEEVHIEEEATFTYNEVSKRPGLNDFLESFEVADEKPQEFVFEGRHEPVNLEDIKVDEDIIGEEIETEFSFSRSFAPPEKEGEEEPQIEENIDITEPEPVTGEIGKNEEPEMDFFAWLQHPKIVAGIESESAAGLVEGEEEREETGPPLEVSPKDPENSRKEIDLLERFIASNPQITRPKKEFYSPENMAKRSEVIDMEYVTETLAELYFSQGNLDLAIKAYEKLSLQNPAKQAYFASLIEKIKKERK